jgi:predicted GTPase
MKRLTRREEEELAELMREALKKPPTIGLVGVSGVGKSSTINTMFKTKLPVSHTVACTKEFWELKLDVKMTQGPAEGQGVNLIVHDAPGLGEDLAKDDEYLAMYRDKLPDCDIILWVLAARNRAVALDQHYLMQLEDFHDRIVFGLNQVDLVEPMNWKMGLPIPSKEQEKHIAEIVEDRGRRLSAVMKRKVEVIPYSTVRGYNLESLFTAMLQTCNGHRSWILSGLKNFSYKDAIPVELLRGRNRVSLGLSEEVGEVEPPDDTEHGGGFFSSLVNKFSGHQSTKKPPTEEELKELESKVLEGRRRLLSKPRG